MYQSWPSAKIADGRPWSAALNGQLTGSTDPLQATQLKEIWKEVAAQVQSQGFELGCWFAPPPPMPAELASALEAGVELPEKAAVEMAESDTGRLRSGVQVVDLLWKDPSARWTIERVLSGPALRLRPSKGGPHRAPVSLVDRAQREALKATCQ